MANSVLGKILGAAKAPTDKKGRSTETAFASIHAIHQVFCKALGEQSVSEGFAPNEVHLENEYGVTSHRFRQGRRRIGRTIPVKRHQAGPMKFAKEAPLAPADDGYVSMPERSLKLPPKIFAFAVVVRLSPKPLRPMVVATKLGIRDRATADKWARKVAKAELVTLHRAARNEAWLGRPGCDFASVRDLSKNHLSRNHLSRKRTAHSTWKEGTPPEGQAPRTERNLVEDTRSDERALHESQLRDWRLAETVTDLKDGLTYFSERPRLEDLKNCPHSLWVSSVERLGPVPRHLKSSFAHAQGWDIGRELVELASSTNCEVREAMIGVADKVASAHRHGNPIFSFGFIFKRIYRQIEAEDDSWLYDLSSRLDDQAAQTARKNAEFAAAVLDKAGLHYDYQRLTSTLGFEELDGLLKTLGEGDKQLGWRMLHEGIHSALRPGDGRIIVRWGYFNDAAQTAVRRERARAGARRRYRDRRH